VCAYLAGGCGCERLSKLTRLKWLVSCRISVGWKPSHISDGGGCVLCDGSRSHSRLRASWSLKRVRVWPFTTASLAVRSPCCRCRCRCCRRCDDCCDRCCCCCICSAVLNVNSRCPSFSPMKLPTSFSAAEDPLHEDWNEYRMVRSLFVFCFVSHTAMPMPLWRQVPHNDPRRVGHRRSQRYRPKRAPPRQGQQHRFFCCCFLVVCRWWKNKGGYITGSKAACV
jgi:hypothetical protein